MERGYRAAGNPSDCPPYDYLTLRAASARRREFTWARLRVMPGAIGGTCARRTFTRTNCPWKRAFASSRSITARAGPNSTSSPRLTPVSLLNYVNHMLPAAERAA